MKFLNRFNSPPAILKILKSKSIAWNKAGDDNKEKIRKEISLFQGEYCAYCEISLEKGKHIEHFAKKGSFPQKMYEWNNLFLSCESQKHCGHFKDNKSLNKYAANYNYLDLIKPDEVDPKDYLFFSSNGEVVPKAGIKEDLKDKAELTINVFNLNEIGLKNIRYKVLENYKEMIEFIYLFDDDSVLSKLIEEQRAEFSKMQFSAALLDLLLTTPEKR